jgi:magnesium transporter
MQKTDRNNEVLLHQTQQLIELNNLPRLTLMLEEHHPADIALLLSALPQNKREQVWEVVPESLSGEVLNELDDNIRASLLGEMETAEVVSALSTLDEDEQADLIQDIPDRTEEILQAMDLERRKRLETVLYYPEDVAGGLMDLDLIAVRADVSVKVVLRYLHKLGTIPESTNKLFVTDRKGIYRGQLMITSLLTNDDDTMIEDILESGDSISANTSAQEASEIFAKLNLISLAVVDDKNTLLGRITIDDIVDFLRDSNQDTLLKMAGTTNEEAFSPVLKSSKFRALWLGINLITALIASWVIMGFQEVIDKMVALAVLMPVVASMGGIAGTQTLSVIIRSIALGQLHKGNKLWILRKEIGIGVLNGLLWAIMIGCVAELWFQIPILSITIAIAIFINLIVATSSGVVVPIVMHRFGIDPAISGGVVLTTITDVVGFFSFLGLATLLIL